MRTSRAPFATSCEAQTPSPATNSEKEASDEAPPFACDLPRRTVDSSSPALLAEESAGSMAQQTSKPHAASAPSLLPPLLGVHLSCGGDPTACLQPADNALSQTAKTPPVLRGEARPSSWSLA